MTQHSCSYMVSLWRPKGNTCYVDTNRACAQESKLSSSKCCRTLLMTLCSDRVLLMLLFFSCYPHHFLLRQFSKVKSLFLPKISRQSLFNIYLMTCMNEKASCMENLVISFATSIITVLIVFALQGLISKLALGYLNVLTFPVWEELADNFHALLSKIAKTIFNTWPHLNGFNGGGWAMC